MASNATVLRLRRRLKEEEHELAQLQKRLESRTKEQAKQNDALEADQETLSASGISKRYVSAVASDPDRKKGGKDDSVPVVSGKVSSLLSRWNEGISEVVEKKERASVRGDVREAQRRFSKKDGKGIKVKKLGGRVEGDLYVEDDEEVPSWAKNQTKRVLKKSNPKSTTRGVDVEQLQDEIQDTGINENRSRTRADIKSSSKNVSSLLARWNKTEKNEEDLSKDLKNMNIDEKTKGSGRKAQSLSAGDPNEPKDPRELALYLQKKIEKVEAQIVEVKRELREADGAR